MNHVASKRPAGKASSPPRRRPDVEALIALVSLDLDVARREATLAGSLAIIERARAEIASCEREIAATREALQRRAEPEALSPEAGELHRRLRDKERCLAHLAQVVEAEQTSALATSAELRDQGTDLPVRRVAIRSRIPQVTLEDYENALRRGLFPAAVATRGRVCWGCFHGLPAAITAEFQEAQTFVICPHCERVLFNPDWIEGR